MKVTAEVELGGFNRAMEEYEKAVNKSWPEILRQQGRLLAVNLATETQPWGSSGEAQRVGKNAVLRDVGRVFAASNGMYERLKEKSLQVARAYWSCMNVGRQDRAERILQANGIDAVHAKKPDPSLHIARRDKRGHVRAKKNQFPAAIIFEARKITTYANQVARRVGTGKAGWAQCAEELGGARGIPQWAKKNRSSSVGGVEDKSSSFNNPSITIENRVRYIANLCSKSAISRAVRIQREKMEKHIERVLEHCKKQAGF